MLKIIINVTISNRFIYELIVTGTKFIHILKDSSKQWENNLKLKLYFDWNVYRAIFKVFNKKKY